MHRLTHPLLLLAFLVAAALPVAAQQTVKLRYAKDGKKPKYVPLKQVLVQVEDGCDLPVGGQDELKCSLVGEQKCKIDTSGDGKPDKTVSPGSVTSLQIKNEHGTFPYAVRMVLDVYKKPCLQPACAMVGVVGGLKIAVIDASMNGKYNDYGEDLMAIGNLPYAYPLSKTLVAGKRAFTIEVHESGQSLTVKAGTEPMVKVDYTSELGGRLKPKMVIFKRQAGWSEDHVALYGNRIGYLPKDDEWEFAYAVFSDYLWAIAGDKMETMNLEKGPGKLKWGAPYVLSTDARLEESGLIRSISAPGAWKAPVLTEKKTKGNFIKMEKPPAVTGRGGEHYIANWIHADKFGFAMPDKGISQFKVEISKGGSQVNGKMGFWKPIDLSGLVKKVASFWVSYEWPAEETTGKLSVVVSCSSGTFGKLKSKPMEIEVTK